MSTRILLVEDHAAFRQAIEAVCGLEPDLHVVGHAGRGDEAASVARASLPDVALVDLDLPGGAGADVVRELRGDLGLPCLVLTGLTDDVALGEAVEAGAAAVLHKSTEISELLAAVRTVAGGGTLLDPTLVSRWLQHLRDRRDDLWRSRVTADALSPREREVLERLAAGEAVAAMATSMGISEQTVETHLRNLRGKLGADSRLEAVLTALRLGLVPPPDYPGSGRPRSS